MGVFDDNILSKAGFDVLRDWMISNVNDSVQRYITEERMRLRNRNAHAASDFSRKGRLWDIITAVWAKNASFIVEHGFDGSTHTAINNSNDPKYLYDVYVGVFTFDNEEFSMINIPVINFAEMLLLTGENRI